MKKRKKSILTPEERAEFARHQEELKRQIDLMTQRIAAAKKQQSA